MALLLPSASFSDAVVISMPTVIKAVSGRDGTRKISLEASNQSCDEEGDVISQSALLNSADHFLKSGHLDIDHFSELHSRLNLSGLPSDWIIGRPLEVHDLGKGRTGVIAEIRRGNPHNPTTNKFDAFWDSLQSDPPVMWRASIYGYPDPASIVDCRTNVCDSGATRFHIQKLLWKSLAVTQNPVNQAITGYVQIVKASTFLQALLKSRDSALGFPDPLQPGGYEGKPPAFVARDYGTTPSVIAPMPDAAYMQSGMHTGDVPPPRGDAGMDGISQVGTPITSPTSPANLENSSLASPPFTANSNAGAAMPPTLMLAAPRNLSDAIGMHTTHMARACPHTEGMNTTEGFRRHFQHCCGLDPDMSDVWAHALMHHLTLQRRRL